MNCTGIVRRLDLLGRITLPSELRRQFNISSLDAVEIFVQDEFILLRKYQPADIFSGSMDDLVEFHGQKVSKDSIIELARLAGLEVN